MTAGTAGSSGAEDGDARGRLMFLHETGTTTFAPTGTTVLAGNDALAGAGGIEMSGTGTLQVTGANPNHTGSLTVSNGTLQVGNGGTTGSLQRDVTATGTGTLSFNRSDAITYAGAVSGTGRLEQAGGGTLTLTGANTHTGGTIVSSGTLQVGNGGTTGSLQGDVTATGTLRFNRSDAVTFGGAVSGTGRLEQASGGTLTLTGANTHTGGTTVSNGTLQVGNGGTTGSLQGDVTATGTGTLRFNRSDAVTFGGAVSGAGRMEQAGSGTLTLTGANTHAGDTTVADGTLVVNGSIGGVTIDSAGALGGTGTVGSITADGRIAPGNSIGTLTTGSIAFNSGSVLAVEIDPLGNADLIDSSGTVTIDTGNRVEVTPQAGSYADGLTYTLIDADTAVTGTFGSVGYATGQSILFDLSLLYSTNQVRLRLDRNSQDFAGVVQNPALAGTGAALDELENRLPSDDPLLQGLFGLESTTALNDGINQVSGGGLGGGTAPALGATHAALASLIGMTGGAGPSSGGFAMAPDLRTRQVAAEGLSLSDLLAMTDPAAAPLEAGGDGDEEGGMAPAIFLESFGGFGGRDGSALIDDTDHWYAGALGGVIWPVDDRLTLSAGIGYSAGFSGTEDGRQATEVDTVLAIGHGQWNQGVWRVDGSVGLARHALESERKIAIGGFAATATGDRPAYELFADIGVGHSFQIDAWSVRPEAGIGLSWLMEEDFSETGAGSANLSVEASATVTVQPRLGFGVAYDWALDDGLTVTPNAHALWLGRFGTAAQDTYTARFTNGATAWDVPNLEAPTHTAAFGAGVTLTDQGDWSVRADYTGRFSADSTDHGFVLGGEIRF